MLDIIVVIAPVAAIVVVSIALARHRRKRLRDIPPQTHQPHSPPTGYDSVAIARAKMEAEATRSHIAS